MFYKHKHYASAYVHTVFPSVLSCFSFQISMKSQSMDEIKLNPFAEINNKQDYLPSYFLLNLILEITWAKINSLRKIVNKFKDKSEMTYSDYLFHLL